MTGPSDRGPLAIALVGGTGKEGHGLAVRWARAGHRIVLGSRDRARARHRADELSAAHGLRIAGDEQVEAVRGADVVVIAVPYRAHAEVLTALRGQVGGRVVIDVTVPLRPPCVREVFIPPAGSAALEARELLGARARVAAALHHISADHLADPGRDIDSDALVCADDADARAVALRLVSELGLRALDAGPLANAIALEALTPVLLHLNHRYRITAGVRITGLAAPAA
ncbi:MAG TPA: NADPH-dependent F420 reductase [Kofleriaceae bacterium]|nr:NADPH-dependent F420 reductase [Kofleriaceae bacterium]